MNLILIRGRYPPIAVRPEDRATYIRCLQEAQSGEGSGNFHALLYDRLNATLDDYLSTLEQTSPPA